MKRPRVFLLSPANSGGVRAQMILSERAQFDLAVKLRQQGAPIGEIYSFVSGLYFRGKMAYAQVFAASPPGTPSALVITPGFGLLPVETLVTPELLQQIGRVPVDSDNAEYRVPLARDARLLRQHVGPECDYVLLGSVASDKYVATLTEVFGEKLLFPSDFVGRGDMSRGGLMLRCARSGMELPYAPVQGSKLHGSRPPRLPKLKREPPS